ncbi:MAG: hypothetical protein U0Y82_09365 [Thermoleophilia bacterium]
MASGDDNGERFDQARVLRQAEELAGHVRDAEERTVALRTLRDRAIIQLLENGMSTRKLGAHLGLTATQVSAVWRRTRPARPSGRRPGTTAD